MSESFSVTDITNDVDNMDDMEAPLSPSTLEKRKQLVQVYETQAQETDKAKQAQQKEQKEQERLALRQKLQSRISSAKKNRSKGGPQNQSQGKAQVQMKMPDLRDGSDGNGNPVTIQDFNKHVAETPGVIEIILQNLGIDREAIPTFSEALRSDARKGRFENQRQFIESLALYLTTPDGQKVPTIPGSNARSFQDAGKDPNFQGLQFKK